MLEAQSMNMSLPRPARRVSIVERNVWVWVDEVTASCKTKPLTKMGTGYLDFNPPDFLIKAHNDALNDVSLNQYGPLFGHDTFREAIAREYSPSFGRAIDPEKEICVGTGASETMLSVLAAYLEPGDEVIVMEPVFTLYLYLISWLGGIAKPVKLKPPSPNTTTSSDEWQLDPADLESAISPRTKFLILNTPHNPLGKVFTASELLTVGNICAKHSIFIIADEVYERVHYTPKFPRVVSLSPTIARITFTVLSVGKAFNATGWRVGFVIAPPDLIPAVRMAHKYQNYTSPSPAQHAAAKGFEVAARVGHWERNRRMMCGKVERFCEVLEHVGLPYVKPDSAYFVMLDVSRVRVPEDFKNAKEAVDMPHDYQVCWLLMERFGVVTIPGSAFYVDQEDPEAHTHVRFTVCKTDEDIDAVKGRLKDLRDYVVG